MINIFTMAFNEEVMIQFFINHYKSRFKECKIIIRDNESTDNTVKIALQNNCEIINYNSNGQIDDFKLRDLKNNCWKSSESDWVLVCDVDELLDITDTQLLYEEQLGSTIIKTQGYDMINMEDNFDLSNIKYGSKDNNYSKSVLFNKKYINEINYECGAHKNNPIGDIKYSENEYNLYHYKFINPEYLVDRFKMTEQRLSENNKKCGMGAYNSDSKEKIMQTFENRRKAAIKIL